MRSIVDVTLYLAFTATVGISFKWLISSWFETRAEIERTRVRQILETRQHLFQKHRRFGNGSTHDAKRLHEELNKAVHEWLTDDDISKATIDWAPGNINPPANRESGPIRFLEIAQLLFSHKTRRLVSELVIEELREDYLLAKKNCKSPMARNWATFCFGFRAFVAFLGCFRAACGTSLGHLIPAALKQWWTLLR